MLIFKLICLSDLYFRKIFCVHFLWRGHFFFSVISLILKDRQAGTNRQADKQKVYILIYICFCRKECISFLLFDLKNRMMLQKEKLIEQHFADFWNAIHQTKSPGNEVDVKQKMIFSFKLGFFKLSEKVLIIFWIWFFRQEGHRSYGKKTSTDLPFVFIIGLLS